MWLYITHYKKDPIYIFPELKLRSLIPNFHTYVSVSNLYITRPVHLSCYSKIGEPIVGIYKSLTDI
jgi:hypothetical protein